MKLATTLVAILWAAMASAQGLAKIDQFWFHCADLQILQAKEIQKSIGLTEAQRSRMNTFAQRHQKKIETLAAEYQKNKKSAEQMQQDPRLVGYFLELKKNVMAQLTANQLKRLGEISLQRLGMAALMDDKVGARVGLSKTQITNLRTAFQQGGQKYAAAERAAADPVLKKYKDKNVKDQKAAAALQKQFEADMAAAMKKAAPKLNAIRAETEKKMLAIMTAKQKSTYTALMGKPFKPA